jgi:undecaprenyl phosphate N,N'-diacetylbacillosamine 1-phosphate transferase
MMYRLVFKTIIDYSVALCALIILLPVLVIITILLYFLNDGKPFFTQFRPGKNNEIFRLIKFKTMNDKVGIDGVLLSDSERITQVGKFVRKTSLDELPQLVNVIKGDMSLIGPRPLLIEYLPLYNETQKRRHEVRPGITGWAQVNGRNAISWTQKFEYDVWYVDNQTFWLDIKILFLTVLKVFKSEGISSNASVTMEVFTGNG